MPVSAGISQKTMALQGPNSSSPICSRSASPSRASTILTFSSSRSSPKRDGSRGPTQEPLCRRGRPPPVRRVSERHDHESARPAPFKRTHTSTGRSPSPTRASPATSLRPARYSTSATPTRFPLRALPLQQGVRRAVHVQDALAHGRAAQDPQDTVIGVLQLINALDAHGSPSRSPGWSRTGPIPSVPGRRGSQERPSHGADQEGPLRLDPTAVGRGRIPGPGHLLPHPEDEPVLGPDLEGHGVEQGRD